MGSSWGRGGGVTSTQNSDQFVLRLIRLGREEIGVAKTNLTAEEKLSVCNIGRLYQWNMGNG